MKEEDIKLYLPKYLSAETEKEFYLGIKQFEVASAYKNLYTSSLVNEKTYFQGDGVKGLLYINLPCRKVAKVNGILLSNTCDITPDNERKFFAPRVMYAPILKLEQYKKSLLKVLSENEVEGHITSLKAQRITQIFYLPSYAGVLEESLVFLDRVCSCSNFAEQTDDIKTKRLFTLSDFGAYLFLVKLSLHFTRIQDKVERGFM